MRGRNRVSIRTEPAAHTAVCGAARGARIRAVSALLTPLAPLSRLLPFFAPVWVRDAWPQAAQSRLTHCLLLALLLHVWLLLMLGNAPPGTAPPGLGVWGALNVTLRGPAQGAPGAVATPPAEPAGPPGAAATPRFGGAVRAPSAQPLPAPGAALRGDLAATPAPSPALAPLQSTAADRAAEPARPRLPPALPGAAALLPLPTSPTSPTLPTLPAPPAAVAAPAVPADPAPAAPALRQVAPMAAAALPVQALAPVQGLPAQAPVGLPSLPAAPTGMPLAALPAGRPDAGPQVGHDLATAPSAAASAPRLNLELARPRGGELSRLGGAGVLPLLPRPPELPDKLARDIDKSAKADCRKAYQGLGLLAVVPLAVDAARGGKDGACKW